VFRSTVLSIVLTLALGQNAALLCGAWWCDPQVPAHECHDTDPSASPVLGGDAGCQAVPPGVAAFAREDSRRGISGQDANPFALITRHQFAPSTTDTHANRQSECRWSFETRPIEAALRI
jgi:hypothetical protein